MHAHAKIWKRRSCSTGEMATATEFATVLINLGETIACLGEYARAEELLREAAALLEPAGLLDNLTGTLAILARIARWQGDLDRARALADQSLGLLSRRNGVLSIPETHERGRIALALGELGSASTWLRQSLRPAHASGHRPEVADALAALAEVSAAAGRPERAARLGGTATAQLVALSRRLPPVDDAAFHAALDAARAALGEQAFAREWAAGQALSLDEAVALALAEGPADA